VAAADHQEPSELLVEPARIWFTDQRSPAVQEVRGARAGKVVQTVAVVVQVVVVAKADQVASHASMMRTGVVQD
jgi:hypothetical protein